MNFHRMLPKIFRATPLLLRLAIATLLAGTALGCGKAGTTQIIVQAPNLRWMDRTLYLALPNGREPDRNNIFQKQKLKDALVDIQGATMLGPDYFSFTEVDEALLRPVVTPTVSGSDFKSFILIWPDAVFNQYVLDQMGGSIPDPFALTVLNTANKRKFFMIMKASCFTTSQACDSIGTGGLRAMVARQFGLMTGLRLKDCNANPTDVMCADSPSDAQWGSTQRQTWSATYSNLLETILQNPSFYDAAPAPSGS